LGQQAAIEGIPKPPAGNSPYDLSAFIIPPPPESTSNTRSSDIIRRLYEAKAGIIEVCTGNMKYSDSQLYFCET